MVARLDEAQRAALAAARPDWATADGRDAIVRQFRFADFSAAWGFMCRVALLAERMDVRMAEAIDRVLAAHG